MRSVNQAVGMQAFEIFANRNLGGFETAGEVQHENPALSFENFENRSAPFFVEQRSPK
jgi:hypothetical protein